MNDELFSVRDQVVVVSGGSRGIGLAIAAGFASRAGQVVITGRDAATLDEAAAGLSRDGARVTPIVCDVTSSDAIRSLVRECIDRFGHVDTLVNCAGVNRRKPALSVDEDDYDFVVDINLKGAYLTAIEFGRHMVQRGRGNQINIASLNSDRPLKNVSTYALSKAGMVGMTRALALEWGRSGVRVNALAPGFILTDLTHKLWSDPTMREWGETNTPLGRLGVPDDMIGTAVFLASEAAAFLTGQILYVDGGFTAGWTWPIPQ
jgi:NAD(P)-dependent dehydrogenase (short-subunit alcohol dehydrogenase family)